MLPTSGVSSAFGLIISHLQAAHRLGIKADLATGTATITSEDVPTQPKPVTVALSSRKRPSSSTAAVSKTEDEPPSKIYKIRTWSMLLWSTVYLQRGLGGPHQPRTSNS